MHGPVQTVLVIRSSHFTFQFRLTTDLWLVCCVIKMRENSLSGSANLFKGVNTIDIHTKWFGNFPRFELSRVNLSHRIQNWFELSGVSRNWGFEKLGWNYRAWVRQIQGKQGLVRDIGRFGKPRVREIGIPLYVNPTEWALQNWEKTSSKVLWNSVN